MLVEKYLPALNCWTEKQMVTFLSLILFLSRGYLGMSGIATNIIIFGSWGTALACAVLNFVLDRKQKGGKTSAN